MQGRALQPRTDRSTGASGDPWQLLHSHPDTGSPTGRCPDPGGVGVGSQGGDVKEREGRIYFNFKMEIIGVYFFHVQRMKIHL